MRIYTTKSNKKPTLVSRRKIVVRNESDIRTITDYWAAALGRQLINRTDGGPEVTFSSIVNTSSFLTYDQPFPIVVMDSRRPGEYIININSTLYEISPYEYGTWDSRVNLFTPTEYLGSNLNDGKPVVNNTCVTDFDNAAYIRT
jgi:lysophospholipase